MFFLSPPLLLFPLLLIFILLFEFERPITEHFFSTLVKLLDCDKTYFD